jgi:regulatory protein
MASRETTPQNEGRASEARVVRESAVRLLTRREHSTVELRRKLTARGHDAAVVESVIESLGQRALVSDARFLESFVRTRTERGVGPIRIRAELRERGLSDDAIDEAVTQTAEYWLERLERVRIKRFGPGRPTGRDAWTRQARFLAQRGFPSDVIYRALGD